MADAMTLRAEAEADALAKSFADKAVKDALDEVEAKAAAQAQRAEREATAAKEREEAVLKTWQDEELKRMSKAGSSAGGVLRAALLVALFAVAAYAAKEAYVHYTTPPEPEPTLLEYYLGVSLW